MLRNTDGNPANEAYVESLGWADRHNEEVFAVFEVRDLVRKTGDWLEALFGEERGARIAEAMLVALATADCRPETDGVRGRVAALTRAEGWRGALETLDPTVDWPSEAATFEWLYAYAIDGVVHEGSELQPVARRREQLETLLAAGDRFVELMPPNWEPASRGPWPLRRIHAAAKARWRLDSGEHLSGADIALLGRLDPRTVLNALSDGRLPSARDGTCSADDAQAWLLSRRPKKFRPSRWTDPADDQDARSPDAEDEGDGDTVWVPVDARGEAFLPHLARPTRAGGLGFRIGAKGEERTFETFFDALSALKEMHPPRWRRPNADGHWGIVRAEPHWRAVPRADVERMLRDAGF